MLADTTSIARRNDGEFGAPAWTERYTYNRCAVKRIRVYRRLRRIDLANVKGRKLRGHRRPVCARVATP
jgi:hypothetical protein